MGEMHIDFVLCSCIQAQYKMLETVALTNNEQSLGNTLKMPIYNICKYGKALLNPCDKAPDDWNPQALFVQGIV